MAQINVNIAGKNYPLACAEGDEGRLEKLAAYIDSKTEVLTQQLGHVSETRLILMAAFLIADELHDALDGKGQPNPFNGISEGEVAAILTEVARDVEAVAERLANA